MNNEITGELPKSDLTKCSRCGVTVNLLGRDACGGIHPGRACNDRDILLVEIEKHRRGRAEAVDKYVDTRKREEKLIEIIKRIDATLRVPAAEYVPAIQAVFEIIEKEGIKGKA